LRPWFAVLLTTLPFPILASVSTGCSSGSAGDGGTASSGAGGSSSHGTSTNTSSSMSVTTGTNSGGMGPGSCPPPPAGISAAAQDAYAAENTARVGAGSPCATLVPELDLSSEKHCAYYAANTSHSNCIANPHVEVAGCDQFYAANFDEREVMAGYQGGP